MIDKSIFRAYDIRGVYPTELDEAGAYKIARAIFEYAKPKKVAVGRDCRLSAPAIHRAVCQGFLDEGCEVTDVGIIATDTKCFVAGAMDFDVAVNVTASHNPKEWIGLKIDKRGGEPVGGAGEIEEIGAIVEQMGLRWQLPKIGLRAVHQLNVLPDWVRHVLSFVKVGEIRPMKIVVDAGNGIAGPIVRELFKSLPIELVEMYFEPDGNFPNHLPSPIEPENTADLRKRVVEERADLGMAFDGDADRVYLVDDQGQLVTGSEMTAMIMDEVLTQDPTRIVLYNAICGWNVRDVVERHKAKAFRTRVGHGFIKKDMRRYDAYFAGEHSGHYFFKDNYYCDSGVIAVMFVLSLMAKEGKSLAGLLEPHRKYFQIPETNFRVRDKQMIIDGLAERFAHEEVDWLDGITIKTLEWWANIRPSQTDSMLRLNVEAKSPEILERVATELAGQIQRLSRQSVKASFDSDRARV
ncbi:MAG: phosphomannomutase/phosphoglucomutase [bacterium]